MFYLEQDEYSMDEARIFLEAKDDANGLLKTEIIDPIINVLNSPANRRAYIQLGTEFLQANSEMLSREFPTKPVSFPRLYVDNVFKLFGFNQKEFKENLKEILKSVNDKTAFQTIIASPTNVVHAIVMLYADMIMMRELRNSARQQMGLSVYNNIFNHFFHPPHPVEGTMAYVYMTLDNSWNLVKAENVINWLDQTIDVAFALWRPRMSLEMNPEALVQFLNRVRSSFRQNMRLLANQYYESLEEKGNLVAGDVGSDEMYLDTKDTSKIRQNLTRRINLGDQLYKEKGRLYIGIAKIKNVKVDSLYDFAQTIDITDISTLIDVIFYVFIVKEGNDISDINSAKFISRITNLPTAVDRAVAGKPYITILSKKYKVDPSIVKAYVCFIATYMMYRVNDAKG